MLFTFWDHSITTAILLTTYKYIALGREKECVLSDFKFWILILLFLCLNWQFLQNESLIAIDARAIRLYFRKNKFKLCNHFLYSRSEFVCVSRKKASFFPLYFVLYTPPIPTSCLKFKIHRELDKVFGETKRKKKGEMKFVPSAPSLDQHYWLHYYTISSTAMCLTWCQESFDVCMILGIPRDPELSINHPWHPITTMVEKK